MTDDPRRSKEVRDDRQSQQVTIESQLAALRELASERGLLIAEELVFADEGFSGANLTRPSLERFRQRPPRRYERQRVERTS